MVERILFIHAKMNRGISYVQVSIMCMDIYMYMYIHVHDYVIILFREWMKLLDQSIMYLRKILILNGEVWINVHVQCIPPSLPPSIPSFIPSFIHPFLHPSLPPSSLPPSIHPSLPSFLPPLLPFNGFFGSQNMLKLIPFSVFLI